MTTETLEAINAKFAQREATILARLSAQDCGVEEAFAIRTDLLSERNAAHKKIAGCKSNVEEKAVAVLRALGELGKINDWNSTQLETLYKTSSQIPEIHEVLIKQALPELAAVEAEKQAANQELEIVKTKYMSLDALFAKTSEKIAQIFVGPLLPQLDSFVKKHAAGNAVSIGWSGEVIFPQHMKATLSELGIESTPIYHGQISPYSVVHLSEDVLAKLTLIANQQPPIDKPSVLGTPEPEAATALPKSAQAPQVS